MSKHKPNLWLAAKDVAINEFFLREGKMKPITHEEAEKQFPDAFRALSDDGVPSATVFMIDIVGVLWVEDGMYPNCPSYWNPETKAWVEDEGHPGHVDPRVYDKDFVQNEED